MLLFRFQNKREARTPIRIIGEFQLRVAMTQLGDTEQDTKTCARLPFRTGSRKVIVVLNNIRHPLLINPHTSVFDGNPNTVFNSIGKNMNFTPFGREFHCISN